MRALVAGIASLLTACTLNIGSMQQVEPVTTAEYIPDMQIFYLHKGAIIMPEELGSVIGVHNRPLPLEGIVLQKMSFDMNEDYKTDAVVYLVNGYPQRFGIDRCSPMYDFYLSIMAGRATITPPRDLSEEILKNKSV